MIRNEGLELGHAMAEVAGRHAGEDWVEMALEALRTHATTHKYFTTEQVRAANQELPEPPDKRAWGAVVRKANRAGIIRSHGWTRAESTTVHGMVVTLWESTLCI